MQDKLAMLRTELAALRGGGGGGGDRASCADTPAPSIGAVDDDDDDDDDEDDDGMSIDDGDSECHADARVGWQHGGALGGGVRTPHKVVHAGALARGGKGGGGSPAVTPVAG